MMRKLLFLALIGMLFCAQSPMMNGFPPGTFQNRAAIDGAATPAYTGPGDIVSGATAWWGLRGYNAAYSGNAIQACLPLDATCTNIAISGGNLNLGTITTLGCNNTTAICTIKTMYDQTGNGNTISQATIGTRPTLTLSCLGSLPCMTCSNNVLSSSTNVAFGTSTISAVYNTTSNVAFANIVAMHFEYGLLNHGSNSQMLYAGAQGSITAADNAFHASQGVFNGASSTYYIDGVSNTVNAGTNSTTNLISICGNDGNTVDRLVGKVAEAGLWSGNFTSGQQTSMNSNQHSYWGF